MHRTLLDGVNDGLLGVEERAVEGNAGGDA